MTKTTRYRDTLAALNDWIPFLLAESNLPGPRGNLELLYAVVAAGDTQRFDECLAHDRPEGTAETAAEFVVMCGVAGQGKLLVAGNRGALDIIRSYANHPQWRLREAAAMALQEYGRADMDGLVAIASDWARTGTLSERRAAVAGICEPALLKDGRHAAPLFTLLDDATEVIATADTATRKSDGFKTLRKGLAYCWSVAIAVYPEGGRDRFEVWCRRAADDRDIRWIVRQNLAKKRMAVPGGNWLDTMRALAG